MAVQLAAGYGLVADDWQADIVDCALCLRKDGRFASGTVGQAVPRQNGKNGWLEVRELFGMIVLGEKILHTAHEVKTARKAFRRLKHFFGEKVADGTAKFPELNALVTELRSVNGQEAIILSNGGSIEFIARSSGSGRGFTVDVLVCDEAQDLTGDELAALLPTISAAPLGNPQVILTGTPPDPAKAHLAKGEVFRRVRNEAQAGTDPDLCFIDYGVPDGPLPDTSDEELVHLTNPALGVRLNIGETRRERKLMSPEEFARERLGWWGDPKKATNLVLPEWPACKTTDEPPAKRLTIGIAVDLDLEWACLGAAAVREDGRVHVSIPEDESGRVDHARGTAWLIPRAKELQDRHGCDVVMDEKCPDADLAQRLREAGVRVTELKLGQMLEATSGLITAVVEGTLTHFDKPDLNDAVAAATKRTVSERPLWARKSGDITPLEAITIARHVALTPTREFWGAVG